MATPLSTLPPPPKGQTGVTLDDLQSLPPPPSGQQGKTLADVQTPLDTQPPKPDFLDTASKTVSSFFPGAKLGEALTNAVGALKPAAAILHGDTRPLIDYGKNNPTNVPALAGDVLSAGAGAALPGVEGFAKNAVLGAGVGAGSKLASGDTDPIHLAESALGGAATAAVPPVVGKVASDFLGKLPVRIAQKALAGATPETAAYALQNAKMAPISTLLKDSKAATASGGRQIDAILEHPDHAGKVVQGANIFERVINGHPDIPQSGLPQSGLTPDVLKQKLAQLVPNHSSLVKELFSEKGLDLKQTNDLRKELDSVVKPVYINGAKVDAPAVSALKQVGAEAASALREQVKSQAKETVPLFENLQREINLRNALGKTQGKLDKKVPLGLYDVIMGSAGFMHGGPVGAAATLATEKALRSPGVQLGVAKTAQKVGPGVSKAVENTVKATKAPLIHALNQ